MLNYLDFSIPCPIANGRAEKFRVYYYKQDSGWLPLPVDICDNGCGSDICINCAASVFKQAADREPPFPK